jgi:hypothetical protein
VETLRDSIGEQVQKPVQGSAYLFGVRRVFVLTIRWWVRHFHTSSWTNKKRHRTASAVRCLTKIELLD